MDLNDGRPRFSSSASVEVKGAESVTGTGHFRPFRALGLGLGRYAASAWFGGLSTAGNLISSRPCRTFLGGRQRLSPGQSEWQGEGGDQQGGLGVSSQPTSEQKGLQLRISPAGAAVVGMFMGPRGPRPAQRACHRAEGESKGACLGYGGRCRQPENLGRLFKPTRRWCWCI